MITVLLIIIAAIAKAVADTVDHHFDTSVFKRMNRSFWDRDVSSEKARRVFAYKIDAWHLFLSLMLFCFMLAIVIHENRFHWWIELGIAGKLFIAVFNLFYNKILRRK